MEGCTCVEHCYIGVLSDMAEHRVNGYLAKEKDCADLANGIKDCIAHSKEWGIVARESVVRKYSVEVVAKQYVELYKGVNEMKTNHDTSN